MEGTIPLPDGRRVRMRRTGSQSWEMEYYIHDQLEDHWTVQSVKPVYDEAVWTMWQKAMPPQTQE